MADIADIFGQGFDRTTEEPAVEYSMIPAGKYPVEIEKSECVPTKAGTGHRIKLQLSIMDGQHKGRKLFAGINIDNPNPVAVEIARKELSALCYATDIPVADTVDVFIGRYCYVGVKIKNEQNEVSAWYNVNDPVIVKLLQSPAVQTPQNNALRQGSPATPQQQAQVTQQAPLQQQSPVQQPIQQPVQQSAAPAQQAAPPWA